MSSLKGIRFVAWIEGRSVVLGAEGLAVVIVLVASKVIASLTVHTQVVPKVVTLEDSVVFDHPMVGVGHEGFENRRRYVGVVVRGQGVTNIVKKGTEDVFIVLSVPFGPGSRLDTVL